jgi:ankyrin repeat protein
VAGGHAGLMELLLLNGAAADTADSEGRSALHWAILHTQDVLALLLLRHRSSAAAQTDAAGRTALDLAMCRGSIEDEELFLALSAL